MASQKKLSVREKIALTALNGLLASGKYIGMRPEENEGPLDVATGPVICQAFDLADQFLAYILEQPVTKRARRKRSP